MAILQTRTPFLFLVCKLLTTGCKKLKFCYMYILYFQMLVKNFINYVTLILKYCDFSDFWLFCILVCKIHQSPKWKLEPIKFWLLFSYISQKYMTTPLTKKIDQIYQLPILFWKIHLCTSCYTLKCNQYCRVHYKYPTLNHETYSQCLK